MRVRNTLLSRPYSFAYARERRGLTSFDVPRDETIATIDVDKAMVLHFAAHRGDLNVAVRVHKTGGGEGQRGRRNPPYNSVVRCERSAYVRLPGPYHLCLGEKPGWGLRQALQTALLDRVSLRLHSTCVQELMGEGGWKVNEKERKRKGGEEDERPLESSHKRPSGGRRCSRRTQLNVLERKW